LAFAGRDEPPVRVARLRAEGKVLEIGSADLSLTREEAAALLRAAEVALGEDDVAELHKRTEGWAAGLYLAALYLREGGTSEEAAASFGGDDRSRLRATRRSGLTSPDRSPRRTAQPAASPDPEKKPGRVAETSAAGIRVRHRLQPHILQPTRGKPPPQCRRWIQAKGHSPARVPAERTECPYLVTWLNQRQ
jgi:hypothetical protein